MLSPQYQEMLHNKSVIRELSEFATARGREIGYDRVYDYSLGNPSVPAPQSVTDTFMELLRTRSPLELHGYSPSLSLPEVRASVAASLSERFGIPYTADYVFMTSGAAGAIAHAIRLVAQPGDEILTIAPFFPEYHPYVDLTGCVLRPVQAVPGSFQPDLSAIDDAINERTAAILIDTPNNPTGAVYTEESLKGLAALLKAASARVGHTIYLISDEPYREIVYDGQTCPNPSAYYDDSIMCYSFSKSLSLPGERIGYLAVNPAAEGAELMVPMCGQISRGIGHNCPSSLMQLAVARNLDCTADLSVYEKNMNLLYDTLTGLGFEVARPGGTFYIFPKAPEDATVFCKKALAYDLVLVPSESFGTSGYFRMAYCIDTDKVERSIPELERFVRAEYKTL